jgi:hypothetical protein
MAGNKRSHTETDNNDGTSSGQGQGQIPGSLPQRRHVKTKNNPSGSAVIRPPPEAYNATAHRSHAFAGNNLLSGSVKPPPGTYHGVVENNNNDDNVNRALAETCQKLYHGHGQGGGGVDMTEVVSAMLVVDVRRMKERNPHYPLNGPLLSVVSRESLAAINNGPTDKTKSNKTSAKASSTAPRAPEHLMSPTSAPPPTTQKFQFGAGPAAGTTTAAPSPSSLFLVAPAMPPPPAAALHPPFTFGSPAGAGSTGGTTNAFSFNSAPSATTATTGGFGFLGGTGSGGTGGAPAAAVSFSPPAAAVARPSGLSFQPPPANSNNNAAGTANTVDDDVGANDEGVVDDEPSSIAEVIEEGWTLIKSFDGVDVKRSIEKGYARVRTGQLMVQQAVATGKKRLVMKDLADTFLNMVIVATPRFTAAAGGAGKPDHIFLLGDNILAADKAAGGKQMIVLKLHKPYSQELFDLMKIQ